MNLFQNNFFGRQFLKNYTPPPLDVGFQPIDGWMVYKMCGIFIIFETFALFPFVSAINRLFRSPFVVRWLPGKRDSFVNQTTVYDPRVSNLVCHRIDFNFYYPDKISIELSIYTDVR